MTARDRPGRKVGRNEPCPCGCGRKHKRCCLGKGPAAPFTPDERVSAVGKLRDFAEEELGPEDDDAYDAFYEPWRGDERFDALGGEWMEFSEAVYDMWFFFDRVLDGGRRAVDAFLEQGTPLPAGERRYLDLARETAMRLYEVEDATPGTSVTLRDVAAGTRLAVHERLGSRSMDRHALVAARIIARGASGQPEIEAGFLHIPDLIREALISQVASHRESYRRENPGSAEREFDEEMAPFFHEAWMSCLIDPPLPRLKNTDGEDVSTTRVRFEVADPDGLQAVLDGAPDIVREEEGKAAWLWSGEDPRGAPIVLGRVAWRGQSLELECNSPPRGERGRAMIEALAGDKVRHLSTSHESVAMAVRDRLRSGERAAEPASGLSREEQEALTLDALARHYRSWLDEPVPALTDRTPREAARDEALRPKLIGLIGQLEGHYQTALRRGEPAYDPSWMWDELGLAARSPLAHPPPLAHERLASVVPGLGELCSDVARHARRRPGFDDARTILTAGDIRANLEVWQFLRGRPPAVDAGASGGAAADLEAHIRFIVNFELHRRKTFWVDESLAYMLANTELDVTGSELRMPFPCFAVVFTDRAVLSLAERMLSADRRCPLAGHFLRVATVYVTEERLAEERVVRLGLALDALGADPPHLVVHEIPLADDGEVQRHLEELAPRIVTDPPVADSSPLRGLLHVTLNAILYATSAGVEPKLQGSPGSARRGRDGSEAGAPALSSESVYFLPGSIEISRLRRMQDLERTSTGRSMLHRFMVRGHWRRAAANWTDQRLRWIEPYWKGPDLAAVIERTYKLVP